jgi:hypothetical protein
MSVRMIEVENRWTDLVETLYGRYGIEGCPKFVLFNSLQSVIPT